MKDNKVFKIIKAVIYWCLIAISVVMLIFTIISTTTLDKNNRSIFGVKLYSVLSDSMSSTDFKAGDLIIVKEVDPSTLKEGDIITFISSNPESLGEVVTHKIRKLTTDSENHPGFITYGTNTGDDDSAIVTYPYILGKYTNKITNGGLFFEFLKSTGGYVFCILLPLLLLIISQGVNSIILFKKYKQEQASALEEEKAQIEKEKEENRKMLEELMKLKQELEAKKTEENK